MARKKNMKNKKNGEMNGKANNLLSMVKSMSVESVPDYTGKSSRAGRIANNPWQNRLGRLILEKPQGIYDIGKRNFYSGIATPEFLSLFSYTDYSVEYGDSKLAVRNMDGKVIILLFSKDRSRLIAISTDLVQGLSWLNKYIEDKTTKHVKKVIPMNDWENLLNMLSEKINQ